MLFPSLWNVILTYFFYDSLWGDLEYMGLRGSFQPFIPRSMSLCIY